MRVGIAWMKFKRIMGFMHVQCPDLEIFTWKIKTDIFFSYVALPLPDK